MKKILYGVIYFFVLATIFKGFLTELAEGMGIDVPASNSGIVFLSKDGGENWQAPKIPHNVNGDTLFFDLANYPNIFLASNNGIFQINEKEVTYQNNGLKKLGLSQFSEFVQNPQNPNIFYLVSNKIEKSELLISYDYGENFKTILKTENNDRISVFKVDPINSDYLYAGTEGGLFLTSSDGGISWQKKKSFSPRPIKNIAINDVSGDIYVSVSQKLIDFFSPKGTKKFDSAVYKSIDGGNSFFKIKKLDGVKVKKIETDSNSGRVYFVSSHKILVLEKDKISSLNLMSSLKNEEITAFTIDPKNFNILYIGISDILYKTKNGGKTWSIINVPFSQGKIRDIKINQENPNTILIIVTN